MAKNWLFYFFFFVVLVVVGLEKKQKSFKKVNAKKDVCQISRLNDFLEKLINKHYSTQSILINVRNALKRVLFFEIINNCSKKTLFFQKRIIRLLFFCVRL